MYAVRRLSRTGARVGLLLAFGLALVPAGSARAATQLSATKTAWFWSSNQDITTCGQGFCGGGSLTNGVFSNGQGAASPISPGHMGVAMKNGSSDMRSYLRFDTSAIPTGSTISSFIVTISVSNPDATHTPEHATFAASGQGHPPATTNASAASIVACAVKQPFGDNMAGGGGGDPPYSTSVTPPTDSADHMVHVATTQNEPFSDCSLNGTGAPSGDGSTWSFDITNIAQAWASGKIFNEGIALLPQNNNVSATWTIEFHGNPLVLAEKAGPTTFVTPAEAPHASVEFTSGSSTPPAVADSPPPAPLPPVIETAPLPVPSIPTEVQGEHFTNPNNDTGSTVAAAPVAFVGSVPGWAYVFFPLLILGLALISRVIGFDPIEIGATAGGSRIAGVLHARRVDGELSMPPGTQQILAEENETER